MEYELYANLEAWVMADWSVQIQYFFSSSKIR